MSQKISFKKVIDDPAAYALSSAKLGGALWLLAVLVLRPSPFAPPWSAAMLLLAPLVLVPLALRLVEPDGTWVVLRAAWGSAIKVQLPSAIFLVPAFFIEPSWYAAALALPWLLATLLIAFIGVLRVWLVAAQNLAELAMGAGLVYLAIGGIWLFLDRLGARPLNFEATIVLLTAIHFHYAGFLLPLFTGLLARRLQSGAAKLAAFGAVAGVPLVALGITATQLGLPPVFETLAAEFTALAGLLAAILHVHVASRTESALATSTAKTSTKILWALCGLALAFSMALSALYGVRFYFLQTWLDLPMMRVLHGTANALGFGLAGVLAWNGALAPPQARREF